jgi:hypothetical protein
MAKRAPFTVGSDTFLMQLSTGFFVIVVRESCYPFYEPSYTEHSHGCSQEVQVER